MVDSLIDKLIELAIAEDIGDGDHSSLSCIPSEAVGGVKLMMKQQGIIAGIDIAKRIYFKIDSEVEFQPLVEDGIMLNKGDFVFNASGRVHSLLQAERIVLNVMQRMSGIATQTSRYVKMVEGTKAKILDTRKTTPGMRVFDKLAVRIGGGQGRSL